MDSSRFVFEPLEPRRFLNTAVLQEISADYDPVNATPVIDAPVGDAQPAQPMPFPDSGIAIGRTDHPGGADAFTFRTKPGYIYSFRFAEDSPVQPYLNIRNQAGKFMVSETNIRCVGDSCSREFPFITWSPPAEGTYTLEIWRDSSFDHLTNGEYKIVMDAIPPANLPDPSASMITPGQLTLQSSPVATPKLFQFHALSNAAYSFTPTDPFSPTPIIQVLSADGAVLAENNTPRSLSADWLSTADATVYLRIITDPYSPATVEMSQRIDDQDGQRPIGIITETDIVDAVADGKDVNDVRIRDLMTSNLIFCTAATSIRDAAKSMMTGKFRHLPVLDDTELVGMVDIGDVSRALLGRPTD